MATRVPTYTIPSVYQRLDSRITDPDAFVNVRDQSVARQNHNKLVARGIKRHLCTMMCGVPNGSLYGFSFFYSLLPLSRENGTMLFSVPVSLSSHTKEIEIVINAYRTSASANCRLYPVVDGSGALSEIDTSNYLDITNTGSPPAKHTITVPVPREAAESNFGMVSLYFEGVMYGSNYFTGWYSITDVGPNFVDVDTAGGTAPVGNIGLFTQSSELRPNMITGAVNTTGNIYRCWLESPLSNYLNPYSDTVQAKLCIGVFLATASIYELSTSDFSYDPGLI